MGSMGSRHAEGPLALVSGCDFLAMISGCQGLVMLAL